MSKPKLTWHFYSSRRRGLTVEKYVETNKIKSLDELRESLRQKGVQLPDDDLLKDLFKPEWTGKYPPKAKKASPSKAQTSKDKRNAKSSKPTAQRKKKASKSEKKSTYLQAAYETGSHDEETDAESGA